MMKRILVVLAIAAATCACSMVSSFIHDDDVVASIGDAKLYRAQLEAYIPAGVSAEDSTNLAKRFIDTWATEILFKKMADTQLTKEELDVTQELEDYRKSLLRFRYEQKYINTRLDTLVTEEQIQSYYDAHKPDFVLERPILKVRYVDIMKESQDKARILKLMASDDPDDVAEVADLAFSSALKYFDNSSVWMDAALLAREFGADYGTLLSSLKNNYITLDLEDKGDVKVAYVCDIQRSGTAPVEFCAERIRDILLSGRKHSLMSTLEQELLTDALEQGNLIIY